VHGIRTLTLEHGIKEKNTFARIDALKALKKLEPETAENLNEAFKLFIKLRLAQQIDQQHAHNRLDLSKIDRTERDLLRHSLHVVKKFKQLLNHHYQIRD
ncbi:putative nucleotidyltransferase substrate binding domain-containing protein, partial [Vibrio campbellii]